MQVTAGTSWAVGLGGQALMMAASVASDVANSATGKFAWFTGACLALAGGIALLGPVIAKARREQLAVTAESDRAELAKCRQECEEHTAELKEAREEIADLRREIRLMDGQLMDLRTEGARVTRLLTEWGRWRIEQSPETGPGEANHQTDPAEIRVIHPGKMLPTTTDANADQTPSPDVSEPRP